MGEPYGVPCAYWLLLGSDIQLMDKTYHLTRAAELIRETSFSIAQGFAKEIPQPPAEAEMMELFNKAELM